ncbi:MAG: glycosyltransferase family 9 protein [Candidatus Omnitrophica bacterium]|nr:glycosyltransferase family 9 protein [Candidatus Omnitrophota bacterium]
MLPKFGLKRLSRTRMKNIKNILIIGLSSIGDNLLISPSIRRIKYCCENSSIDFVVGPRAVAFAEKNPLFSHIYIWDKKTGAKTLIKMLENKKYDIIVDFRNSLLPFFLNAEYRVTFFVRELFSRKFSTHESERVLKFIEPYFGKSESVELYFPLYHAEIDEHKKAFERTGISLDSDNFIVLNPGAAFEKKRWNKDRFAEVARTIILKYGVKVIIVGSSDEFGLVEEIIAKIRDEKALNLAGKISFRQLACLLSRSMLLITNDTGTMHLACAMKCPVIAIFGPGNPLRYGPIATKSIVLHTERKCFPCRLEARCDKDFVCMNDVAVQDVISAVEKFLSPH